MRLVSFFLYIFVSLYYSIAEASVSIIDFIVDSIVLEGPPASGPVTSKLVLLL